MGDRQDIDALLIGALYGELDAADEARLEAHLASHPGDRATMDALAETRTRVRDGLAHMADVDPAPAISTLILQEAARRAPRKAPAPGERVGVFAWLANLFQPVARHPALAGAMALALVAGTAGVLYEKGKVSHEERPVATAEMGPTGTAATVPLADKNQPATGEKTETDSYQVKLAEQQERADQLAQNGANADQDRDGAGDDGVRGQLALSGKDNDTRGAAPVAGGRAIAPQRHGAGTATATPSVASNTRALQKGAASGSGSGYMEVTTLDRQPKSLDDEGGANAGFYAGATGGGGGGAGGGQGQSVAGPSNTANAITSGDAVATKPAPAPKTPTAAPGGSYDPAADAKLTEWAKVQHQHMLALVKAGNCVDAGKLGSEIAMKAPEYYAANIENDRAVRACKQYIDQDKRKKANEQYKSRARADEPALEAPAAAH